MSIMKTLKQYDVEIRTLEKRLEDLKSKRHKLELDTCKHSWRDESYENGHNGDYEEVIRCRKCGAWDRDIKEFKCGHNHDFHQDGKNQKCSKCGIVTEQ